MVILSSLSDRHSTIPAMRRCSCCVWVWGYGSLHGQLWRSSQCQAPFPNFQWTSQAWLGGLSECLGPLVLAPAPDPCLPPPEAPPPLLLFPRFPRGLQPLLVEETAATSSPSTDLIVRLATTEVEAAFDAHTLSAWSKTCSTVSVLNSWSAMVFLTAWGRDRLQMPRTMSAQWHPDRVHARESDLKTGPHPEPGPTLLSTLDLTPSDCLFVSQGVTIWCWG